LYFNKADPDSDSNVTLEEFKKFAADEQKVADDKGAALADPEKVFFLTADFYP
jgi:hypothetical protein